MNFSMEGVRLTAVTAALPQSRLDMRSLGSLYGDLEVRRIIESTGVASVRVAESLRTSDLCVAAARHLLAHTRLAASGIDAVVVITQTPDELMPGVSFAVQERLGLGRHCMAFDLNYGCSGFVHGLLQAAMLVRSGCRKVLLCSGDVTTKLIKPGDRQSQMVFGDAVGAALIEAGSERIDFAFDTDGSGRPHLHTPLSYENQTDSAASIGHLSMNGSEVMNFALSRVPPVVKELLARCEVEKSAIDLALFHQANSFMLRYLRKLTGFTSEQMLIGMSETGNTGPASIPLLMAMQQMQPEQVWGKVMLCGFGIGLSIAAAILPMHDTLRIAPVDVEGI